MAKFEIGAKVLNIQTKEKGIVLSVFPERRGRQLYKVSYSGNEIDEMESRLMEDVNIAEPIERCKQRIYGTFEDFSLINTTYKINNSNNNNISSLKASKTLFKAYQFKPLLKFLNSDNRRILVADEVGLGKTIEAGHIMLEMKARKELRNALIVCPMSLQLKWKEELKSKFGIVFTIYEKSSDLIRDLMDRDGSVRGIINYEKLRLKESKDDNKDKSTDKKKKEDLFEYIINNYKKFDFVICDEAHKLRNSDTQTYKGVKILLDVTSSVVFLTATPIMISTDNLYNLLHLLDSQRFSNLQIFNNNLSVNRPFIKALSDLNTYKPVKEIINDLRNAEVSIEYIIGDNRYNNGTQTIDELYSDIPLYQKIIKDVNSYSDSDTLRARLQFDISSMSPLNSIFSRTRKKEVTTDFSQPVRKPHTHIVNLHEDEREEFDRVIDEYYDDNSYINEYGDAKLTFGGALGLVQKKRRIASSVYATINSIDDLNIGMDAFAECRDAKVEELVKIINEVLINGNKKIIVFALFKNTIKYLAIRLRKYGLNAVSIHGDIENRDEVIMKFRDDDHIQVLLSSEVGSEGLDMQFCNSMVNYDLPWNPMVVEQRIGRIDRFGQESPVVNIYNLVVHNSIQEEIYVRLLERIGIFRDSIGDLEAILDRELEISGVGATNISALFSETEREFYCKKLSEDDRKAKLAQIERAFEFEKNMLKDVESGLKNTLTNDEYFKNEINKILTNNSYVTEFELINYMEMLIKHRLTSCVMSKNDDESFNIIIPKSLPKSLTGFLEENMPSSSELQSIFREFKNKIMDSTEIPVTFNQEYAFTNKNVIYMNIYNPLVVAAAKYFSENSDKFNTTFYFKIPKKEVKVSSGIYFLALYQIKMSKFMFGTLSETELLHPIIYDFSSEKLLLDKDLIDDLYGKSQVTGEYSSKENLLLDVEKIEDMRYVLADSINEYIDEFTADQKIRLDTEKQIQIQRTKEMFAARKTALTLSIEQQQRDLQSEMLYSDNDKRIRQIKSGIRLSEFNLNRINMDEDEALSKFHKMSVNLQNPSLISLSCLKID